MPAAARGDSRDKVLSKTGRGKKCSKPRTTSTSGRSSDTFVNGFGCVRQGDVVALHPARGCGPDVSVLTVHSSKVFINLKGAGRIGDKYTSDNTITTGSSDTFFG